MRVPLYLALFLAAVACNTGQNDRDHLLPCDMEYPLSEMYFDEDDNLEVQIKFWEVVTDSAKSRPLPAWYVGKALDNLNELYRLGNLTFTHAATEVLVERRFDGRMEFFRGIARTYQDPRFLNVFVFSEHSDFPYPGSAAAIPSISIAMKRNTLLSSVLAHEIGHAYGLHHTHAADNSDGYRIDTGDLVCDTPKSDPMSGEVSGKCEYIGQQDLTEAEAAVLVCNVMSYSLRDCRVCITPGQVNRMRFIIEQSEDLRNTVQYAMF